MSREPPTVVELPGLVVTEHTFEVPLDHSRREGLQIEVFAREVAHPDGRDRPFLVMFAGGPGSEAGRPVPTPRAPSWLDRALADFRVLLLDQRGTGRSTPVGALTELSPPEQAEYLTHFRADAIVRDAELIRHELGVERWSVLGQSFGGFCVTTYLSLAPDGLREAFITGGIPALRTPVDDVYAHTYRRVLERNRRYLARYPHDQERLRSLRRELEGSREAEGSPVLPGGDPLTWRRFRQLGLLLGMSDGAERLHYILELPFDSPAFLHDVEQSLSFARNPLYAILHEACHADGGATRWSAERMLPAQFEDSELLTGEHVFPWMFDEYGALVPLRDAAYALAEHSWPTLYDPDALRANHVPVAAAVYTEDMYVERSLSERTAADIRGIRTWVTSEFDHNGLRVAGDRILDRLIGLARGRI